MSLPSIDELLASSGRWLHRALDTWWGESEEEALALAGISFEHLCKAFLSSYHPTLIVDTRHPFDSLLGALQLGHLKKRPGDATKTISASEAWIRVQQVHTWETSTDAIPELINIRNGTLHVGATAGAMRRKVFIQFLKISLELRHRMYAGQSMDTVLGAEHARLAQELFEQDQEAREKDVAQRLKVAEDTLKSRLGGVSPMQLESERRMMQDQERSKISLAGVPEGPSSDETGWFINRIESMKCPTVDCNDPNGTAIGFMHYRDEDEAVMFIPVIFSCGVCGLRLPSPDHLRVAGVPPMWPLPDEPPLFLGVEPIGS